MSPASDEIALHQPPPAASHFHAPAFKDNFKRLDVGDINAWNDTTGRWKRGPYAVGFKGLSWPDDSPYGPYEINRERQFYPGFKYRSPRNWSGLRINADGLCMRSRPVDTRALIELDRARVKGHETLASGANGPFTRDLQVPYLGEMLSTYGRFSMGFGKFEYRARMPYGAMAHATDFTAMSTVFPALWLLEAIHAGRGIDGQLRADGKTYMPAKHNLGGVLTEIDLAEGFGYERNTIHQTLHHHAFTSQNTVSDPLGVVIDANVFYDWFTVAVVITPEKIGFYINDKCTRALITPDEIKLGMRVPTFTAAQQYKATGFTDAYQTHDGTTDRRYMQFCMIMNVARDAKLTRDLARQAFNGGYSMPPHPASTEMFVSNVTASPLTAASGNPDVKGMTVNGTFVDTTSGGYEALTA